MNLDSANLATSNTTEEVQEKCRYAIYFSLPTDHPIYRLATLWLGYDVNTGRFIEDFEQQVYHRDMSKLAEFTTDPKRYGFHATLKAPFSLIEGKTLEDLKLELNAFCEEHKAFKCKPLKIKKIGKLLTLSTVAPCKKLNNLAADCVTNFEEFRASSTKEERERRTSDDLSERQLELLKKWGHPFVLDQFNFHMTLSNELEKDDAKAVRKCLDELFRSFLGKPLRVDQICLFHQVNRDEPFKLLESFPLGN